MTFNLKSVIIEPTKIKYGTPDTTKLFKDYKIISSTSFRGPKQTVNQQDAMMRVVIDMPLTEWKKLRSRIEMANTEVENYDI